MRELTYEQAEGIVLRHLPFIEEGGHIPFETLASRVRESLDFEIDIGAARATAWEVVRRSHRQGNPIICTTWPWIPMCYSRFHPDSLLVVDALRGQRWRSSDYRVRCGGLSLYLLLVQRGSIAPGLQSMQAISELGVEASLGGERGLVAFFRYD